MELTLKYYHYFGDEEEKLGSNLNNSDSWDALRIKDGMNSSYYIPKDRDEWQKICLSRENLKLKAKEIVGDRRYVESSGSHQVFIGGLPSR